MKIRNGLNNNISEVFSIKQLSQLILESMLMEVNCSPKPGLVDRYNSGAHHDMNYCTFHRSTYALEGTFNRFIRAGYRHKGDFTDLFSRLKMIGLKGEEKMFAATGGVNTQKGLIFSMGIIGAAGGYLIAEGKLKNLKDLRTIIKKITQGIVKDNFVAINKKDKDDLTAGDRAYLEYNITGIRGEVERGFPSVFDNSLPVLKNKIAEGFNIDEALIISLLSLMKKVDDTTIISRGGLSALKWMHKISDKIMTKYKRVNSDKRNQLIEDMNKLFVKKGLSPGGCADLLAVTIFFYFLDTVNINKK